MKKKIWVGIIIGAIILACVIGGIIYAMSRYDSGRSNSETVSSTSVIEDISIATESGVDSEGEEMKDMVYRGVIASIDGERVAIHQVEGFDYGTPEMLFIMGEDTILESDGFEFEVGHFVEVVYNGTATMSIPPQAAAKEMKIVSTIGDSVVSNATIIECQKDDKGDYRIDVTLLNNGEHVVFLVPQDGLENITEEELIEGAKVSAVTRGISTMSIPPQYPVHVLLPYTVSE